MEVVLHAVTQNQERADGVGEGCFPSVNEKPQTEDREAVIRTRSRRILAEIAGLVATDKTGGLDLGSGATGKTGVEVHDALHASGILGGANGLDSKSQWLC